MSRIPRAAVVLSAFAAAALVGGSLPGHAQPARRAAVIVDHGSLPFFARIPEPYLQAAAETPMMFVDRSVGENINDGLTCLSFASASLAPIRCRRYRHVVPAYSSPPGEVDWARPGGYPRARWSYFSFPGLNMPNDLPCGQTDGSWSQNLACFIRYVDEHPTGFKVYSYQPTYFDVASGSDIVNTKTGFFVRGQKKADLGDFEALQERHPSRTFLLHTSNLSRGIGTREATVFNSELRRYVREQGGYLLDVADIESHDPSGRPCVDNRDGVAYATGGRSENHPDDGVAEPAVCQQYTREADGGHLGNPDVGKIRLAKAFWILMAQVAGWHPE